ncbi:MAG: hypothetical protein AB1330_03945 [Bacillota bacterium]
MKRLLHRYGYKPAECETLVVVIMEQAESRYRDWLSTHAALVLGGGSRGLRGKGSTGALTVFHLVMSGSYGYNILKGWIMRHHLGGFGFKEVDPAAFVMARVLEECCCG